MITSTQSPNYHEITQLPNSELIKRAKKALDAFMKAVKDGGNVAEKAQIYNAYQDERLKRVSPVKMQTISPQMQHPTDKC